MAANNIPFQTLVDAGPYKPWDVVYAEWKSFQRFKIWLDNGMQAFLSALIPCSNPTSLFEYDWGIEGQFG